MTKKPYEAPAIIADFMILDESISPERIQELIDSGMKRGPCRLCNCDLLVRGEPRVGHTCPQCLIKLSSDPFEQALVNKYN